MGLFSKYTKTPADDPTALCNILVNLKWVTQSQIEEALEKRRQDEDKKVGEILVSLGYITADQLEAVLNTQQAKRGKVSSKQAVIASLEMQEKLHNKVLSGIKEFGAMASSASEGTHRLVSLKRK